MANKTFIISAPGKVILHGEHAVVHGKVALAVSLNLKTYLRIQPCSDQKVQLNLPNINVHLNWKPAALQFLQSAIDVADVLNPKTASQIQVDQLRRFAGIPEGSTDTASISILCFLYLYSAISASYGQMPSLDILVWSELPIGAGLGSSAAYCVCLAAALLSASGAITCPVPQEKDTTRWNEDELELINKWAFQGEKLIHGNPSGVDNAVGTWGGMLRYHAGKIVPLASVPTLRILLTNTKVSRSTKVLVAGVKDKLNKLPNIIKPVLDSIDAISCECERVLAAIASGIAIDEHYRILEVTFAHRSVTLYCICAESGQIMQYQNLATRCQCNAFNCKAGLTIDHSVNLAPVNLLQDTSPSVVEALKRTLKDLGYDCWETVIGGLGVALHSPSSLHKDIFQLLCDVKNCQ
ncbi:mevalonate kinase [Scyliorhinus canicula]|uniref:mevalonate kinase n=1 Tax=Scyliorhinus canicula TaxID=7830 RepID=UPI0018F482FB|nr:mevalonate kinase [Scyliorhinus canicula]